MNKEITEERIEEVLNRAFLKANENIALDFAGNLKKSCEGQINISAVKGLNLV